MTAIKKNKSFFFVKNKQVMERVDVPKISYINAEGNFCYLKLANRDLVSIKISLRQLLSHFDNECFIRVHKSYVINLEYLERVNIKDKTLVVGEKIIPIGPSYYSELSNRLSLF